jgi:hypothetical protein
MGCVFFSFLCCGILVVFVFVLCLVYPKLPVSLDCLRPVSCVPNVTSVSGLSSTCVLCTQYYQCLWIVLVLCLVYPMLSVCLDCLHPVSCLPSVVSVSGLSILDAPSVCSNVYNGVILQICNVYEPGSFTVNTVDIFRGGSRGGAPGARPP